MHADPGRDLRSRGRLAKSLVQQLVRLPQPSLRPRQRRPAGRRGSQLERKTLDRQRAEGVLDGQFACDPQRHQQGAPVPEAGDRVDIAVALGNDDVGALAAEDVLVCLLGGHRDDSPYPGVRGQAGEPLVDEPVHYHRHARSRMGMPSQPLPAREDDLTHVEGPGAESASARRAGVDRDRRHLDS